MRNRFSGAYMALLNACRQRSDGAIETLVVDFFDAAVRCSDYWERQFCRVERILTSALARDEMPEGLRASIVAQRYGTRRDAGLLTEQEAQLVERYRNLSPIERQAVRQIVGWAASAANVDRTADTQ
jgi:hypothetical protein